MGSKKKAASNKDPEPLPGPKTVVPQSDSSLNAMRSGVFSEALMVPDADRPRYEKIQKDLFKQLRPRTAAQRIAFENIVACAWRCVLALRLESKRAMTLLTDQTELQLEDSKPVSVDMVRWFGSSKLELRNAIRWLLLLNERFEEAGYLTDEDKEVLLRFFGPGFVDLVGDWPDTMTKQVIMAVESTAAHSRNFGLDKPKFASVMGRVENPKDKNPEDADKDNPEQRAVGDKKRELAMVAKLINLKRLFLEELLKFTEQAWVTANSSANNEFNPRYFASASKDLRRAFDWFLELKEQNL